LIVYFILLNNIFDLVEASGIEPLSKDYRKKFLQAYPPLAEIFAPYLSPDIGAFFQSLPNYYTGCPLLGVRGRWLRRFMQTPEQKPNFCWQLFCFDWINETIGSACGFIGKIFVEA